MTSAVRADGEGPDEVMSTTTASAEAQLLNNGNATAAAAVVLQPLEKSMATQLYKLSADDSTAWAKLLNCANVAGLLLFSALQREGRKGLNVNWITGSPGDWFARAMLSGREKKDQKWVATCLQGAYEDLVQKMETSQRLAAPMVAERAHKAVSDAHQKYPLIPPPAAYQVPGVSLMPFGSFRSCITEFLTVYEELCVKGEVKEDGVHGNIGEIKYVTVGSAVLQEKSLQAVSERLHKCKKFKEILDIVGKSKTSRIALEKQRKAAIAKVERKRKAWLKNYLRRQANSMERNVTSIPTKGDSSPQLYPIYEASQPKVFETDRSPATVASSATTHPPAATVATEHAASLKPETTRSSSANHSHLGMSLVGKLVAREFDEGIFFGRIKEYLPEGSIQGANFDMWNVVYDDGDEADYAIAEVEAMMALSETYV